MSEVLYPIGYGTGLVTMQRLRERYEPKMHPEFARRLFRWIEAQGGHVGIGGGWRDNGSQPDKPGFAPEGKSFHQFQTFPSGTFYCAVDLVCRNGSAVHRAPKWSEVPVQGSGSSLYWGVHANVSTESWHMQPIEIDGWQTWVNMGKPDLEYNYRVFSKELNMKIATSPTRVYDSRAGSNPFRDGETRAIAVQAGTNAVFVNITVDGPRGTGYLTAWSGSGGRPNASHLNYRYGTAICNGVWIPVDSAGNINIFCSKATHVIIDLLAIAN